MIWPPQIVQGVKLPNFNCLYCSQQLENSVAATARVQPAPCNPAMPIEPSPPGWSGGFSNHLLNVNPWLVYKWIIWYYLCFCFCHRSCDWYLWCQQERALEKGNINSFPSWTWQFEAPLVGSAAVPRFSTAASSGFPSMITAPSVVSNHLHYPNTMVHDRYTQSIINPNMPHFCCRSWVVKNGHNKESFLYIEGVNKGRKTETTCCNHMFKRKIFYMYK